MYHSLSEDPNLLDVNFSPMMAKGLRNVLKGSAYVPVTLSAVAEEGRMALEFTLDRVRVSKGTVALASFRDTTLAIPAGPFKVRNSATGKPTRSTRTATSPSAFRTRTGRMSGAFRSSRRSAATSVR